MAERFQPIDMREWARAEDDGFYMLEDSAPRPNGLKQAETLFIAPTPHKMESVRSIDSYDQFDVQALERMVAEGGK